MPNESFIRWQGRSIQQLGFVNNLLIGLSTGIFIFEINIAFEKMNSIRSIVLWFLLISIVFIALCIVFGCLTAWIRLKDFNITTRIARLRETGKKNGIESLRKRTKMLDCSTWVILTLQAIFFILGLVPLLIAGIILLKSG